MMLWERLYSIELFWLAMATVGAVVGLNYYFGTILASPSVSYWYLGCVIVLAAVCPILAFQYKKRRPFRPVGDILARRVNMAAEEELFRLQVNRTRLGGEVRNLRATLRNGVTAMTQSEEQIDRERKEFSRKVANLIALKRRTKGAATRATSPTRSRSEPPAATTRLTRLTRSPIRLSQSRRRPKPTASSGTDARRSSS